jgi:subtilisin family serine protease
MATAGPSIARSPAGACALAVAVALCGARGAAAQAPAAGMGLNPVSATEPWSDSHIVVRLKPGSVPMRDPDGKLSFRAPGLGADESDALAAVLHALGARLAVPLPEKPVADPALAAAVGLRDWWRIELEPGMNTLAAADMVRASWPGVEVAGVDGIGGVADVPNDASFALQYALRNTGQSGGVVGADIRAVEAWDIATGNPDIVIGVIDSGISPHPELAGRILPGINIPLGTAVATDVCNHGTHVAGIIAATRNNGVGIAGVCGTAKLLPVVIVNPCSGLETWVADGITWAVDNGADILNMSLQYSLGSDYLHAAVQYAAARGVPMVCATGNANSAVAFPARWPETVAVASVTAANVRALSSNYGPEVDIAAPGDQIYSLSSSGGYLYKSGTSMAAPHITGIMALMRAINPGMSPSAMREAISLTARDIGAQGWDIFTGHGVADAHQALVLTGATYQPADLNADGTVDGMDLAALLAAWGPCVTASCPGDINSDDAVDGTDLSALLAAWGWGS